MDPLSQSHFHQRVHDQLYGHILPFWCGPALDHEQGGWMAWLANDLTPDRTQPKGLIVNSRILWAFSAVYQAKPHALYRQMAERAFEVVRNRFWDQDNGGAFWQLTGDGCVLDDSKKTYGQAFYIYALAEYHHAFATGAKAVSASVVGQSVPAAAVPAGVSPAGRLGRRHTHPSTAGETPAATAAAGTDCPTTLAAAAGTDCPTTLAAAAGTDCPTTLAAAAGTDCPTAPALARAIELFELIERHAHDPQHGGYFEVRRRDWSEAANSQLSTKDMDTAKSMNNHLHVLEAYTNLFRVWPDPRVAQRLRELIALFEQRILDSRTHHLHHFFDEGWQVRSDTYTFGHDIEGSWLLCEAAEVLGDEALLTRVHALALCMAEAVLTEGVDRDGGLCYEGQAGKIIDAGKECWPQAEAVVGFLNAFQLSGDARFLQAARRVWRYIEDHLVDRIHGEWFWRINPDGCPDPKLPKVSEWKGPYHGTRACLETLHRLELLRAASA